MERVRRFLLCVSLANLFFLDEWDRVATRWIDAALPAPPNLALAQFFAPVLLAILAVAIVFWIVATIVPRLSRCLLLIALFAPLNLFRITVLHLERQDLGRYGAIALAVVLAFAAVYWRDKFIRLVTATPIILGPLLPIQVAYNLYRFEHLPLASAYQNQPSATLLNFHPDRPRIIWIIFDELDQSILSAHHLPNFERLTAESISYTHVDAAGYYTMESIPSMLTGRHVAHGRELGPGDLAVMLDNTSRAVRWSTQRNLFDDLHAAGYSCALLGSELPYCRAIGQSLSSCDWFPSPTTEIALERPSILDRTLYLLRTRPFAFPWLSSTRFFKTPLFDEETRRQSRAAEAASFEGMRHRAQELAVDTRFQLVYMHFPIPHLLGFYDRRTGRYSTSDSSSYLDNLALADRTLGEIRSALESAGLRDSATLIVTSDHPLREFMLDAASWWNDRETASLGSYERRYVPLFIKTPQPRPRIVDQPFNEIEIHNIIRDLLAPRPLR